MIDKIQRSSWGRWLHVEIGNKYHIIYRVIFIIRLKRSTIFNIFQYLESSYECVEDEITNFDVESPRKIIPIEFRGVV